MLFELQGSVPDKMKRVSRSGLVLSAYAYRVVRGMDIQNAKVYQMCRRCEAKHRNCDGQHNVTRGGCEVKKKVQQKLKVKRVNVRYAELKDKKKTCADRFDQSSR